VKNTPESNGKVGILGISYDGFLPLMALVNPHPALKVSVPMNPMVDGWMGDDWFHNGAFPPADDGLHLRAGSDPRQRRALVDEPISMPTTCSWRPDQPGSSAAGAASSRSASGANFSSNPAYDAFWRDQAVDKILAAQPLNVPVMLVHSLWDQEDIYGALPSTRALEPKDARQRQGLPGDGPWHHGRRSATAAARRAEVRQRHGAAFPPEILRRSSITT
jgi:predicted acyl esterase